MKNPTKTYQDVRCSGHRLRIFSAIIASMTTASSIQAATKYEVEDLPFASSDYVDIYTSSEASGTNHQWHRTRSSDNGDYVEYTVNLAQGGSYDLAVGASTHSRCGQWQLSVNGQSQSTPIELYAANTTWPEFTMGTVSLPAGPNIFRLQVVGVNPANTSGKRQGRFDFFKLSPSTSQPLTAQQKASRFLRQATFGATIPSINALAANISSMGETAAYEAWINAQFALPASLHEPLQAEMVAEYSTPTHLMFTRRGDSWWTRIMYGNDQLRQRTAWALSQIVVTSGATDTYIRRNPYGQVNYYDMLMRNSFGNYRNVLYDVARHPIMGRYLGHAGNRKADAVANTFPDENFAREVLQLFSIGLVELNLDGSQKVNASGQAVETYDNTDIVEFARVFTGLNYAGNRGLSPLNLDMSTPMVPYENEHDTGGKILLRGQSVPAGQSTLQDLDAAIGNIFSHPNVAPFIGKLLIQRFTTSNPSYAYIAAVSAAFENNGSGVRGDMKAVIKTILLHPEARSADAAADPEHGKLQEPLISFIALGRAFNISTRNPRGWLISSDSYEASLGMNPYSSPSVFNFYPVDYQPQGPVTDAGLVAPEFGIVNSNTSMTMLNQFRDVLGGRGVSYLYKSTANVTDEVYLDFSRELAILADPAESAAKNNADLLNEIELLLVTGTLKEATRTAILNAMNTSADPHHRLQTAVYLVSLSPEFHIIR